MGECKSGQMNAGTLITLCLPYFEGWSGWKQCEKCSGLTRKCRCSKSNMNSVCTCLKLSLWHHGVAVIKAKADDKG